MFGKELRLSIIQDKINKKRKEIIDQIKEDFEKETAGIEDDT